MHDKNVYSNDRSFPALAQTKHARLEVRGARASVRGDVLSRFIIVICVTVYVTSSTLELWGQPVVLSEFSELAATRGRVEGS